MIINLALLAVFVVGAVAVFRGGLLQGIAMFFAVLLAATFATAWYETLAAYLEKVLPSYTNFLDVASLWILFAVILALLAGPVTLLFRTKVEFAPPVELIGSLLVGLMAGWTVAEFTALSLHTAPLRSDVVPLPPQTMLFGLKPDRCWLWWMRGSSRNGPFAIADRPFDPNEDFLERHAERRKALSGEPPAEEPAAAN